MNSNDVTEPTPVPNAVPAGAPPPPPPPPSRQRADFAASAAMANDILALGGEEATPTSATATSTANSKPRPVPELNEDMDMALSFNGSPMAADFFTSARGKTRSKKHHWKHSR